MVTDKELEAAQDAAETPTETPTEEPQEEPKDETTEEPTEESTEEPADEPAEEPAAEPEDIPDEPEDNAMRSKLGRKLKMMGDEVALLKQELERAKKPRVEEEDLEPDDVITYNELDKILERREAKKREAMASYQTKYVRKLGELGLELDDEEFYAIAQDIDSNYNQEHEDPEIDAKINFTKAQVRYLKGTLNKVSKNPLEKNRDKKPKNLGGPAESTVQPRKLEPVELDDAAKDLVRHLGLSEEKVAEYLKG